MTKSFWVLNQSELSPRDRQGLLADEVLALSRDAGLGWEGNTPGVQHDLVPQDLLLAAALPKGSLAIQHLEQHHTSGPDVHLQGMESKAGHLQCMTLSDHTYISCCMALADYTLA